MPFLTPKSAILGGPESGSRNPGFRGVWDGSGTPGPGTDPPPPPPISLIDHFLIPKRSLSPAKIRGLFFWSGPYFPEYPRPWGDSGTQGPGPEISRFPGCAKSGTTFSRGGESGNPGPRSGTPGDPGILGVQNPGNLGVQKDHFLGSRKAFF